MRANTLYMALTERGFHAFFLPMSAVRIALATARSITPTSPNIAIMRGNDGMNTLHIIMANFTISEPMI